MPDTTTTTLDPEAGFKIGPGVDLDAKTIRIGYLADLTGPFAPLVSEVTDAQAVYWDTVNEGGGIDGWTVEVVLKDESHPLVHVVDETDTEMLAQDLVGPDLFLVELDLRAQDRKIKERPRPHARPGRAHLGPGDHPGRGHTFLGRHGEGEAEQGEHPHGGQDLTDEFWPVAQTPHIIYHSE